ncbi:UDP-N-acetyl-D-mannosaminuronic acid transferase [Paenibacillus pectinilyticus]|uniref:UDP-N-acetyl-D-mannosaminuronic acid transferase n=1 Tax=Paenibacillus pectinilyticus TaxID=512399 RepID=A0A1C0ZSL4_9BACL|nr:WecB/TagA/CpsF family glycosyltransferase [Paenibacillus pectinilyticus]OCT11013.1 UDP-N-acetyl-D-mannosaminuronic acid transferase [Paenibacillus pectinilyticus]
MINKGKHAICGVNISAVDYDSAVQLITNAAQQRIPFAVSALAVHGVMTGYLDTEHRRRLNGLDLVVPDGQPVKWGLNWLYKTGLKERVYGPELTLRVAKAAANQQLSIYLYGSKLETLDLFEENLKEQFPGLQIAGKEPSQFRKLTSEEKMGVVNRIQASGAQLVFVGLGCPRQEVWAFEYRDLLGMPLLAVGAAFDFHAGTLKQAPPWMQKRGLEWFYRMIQEPKRLWKRYMYLNPLYVFTVVGELIGFKKIPVLFPTGSEREQSFG